MCIRDSVDTVRHEIIERYRPGEDDPHLKVLQAAHISDDEYFSQMVRDDLNLIIRDIREAHKKDSESAPQTTVADELKENLEAVENFKGSRDEKLVVLYCKQLGINYKNLSDEEFRWLIPVSYTHLDVYKRQSPHAPGGHWLPDSGSG